jgi:fumarate reductase (CoM/CoB) subunit A
VPRNLTAEYKDRRTNLITIYTRQIKRSTVEVVDGVLITRLLKKNKAVRGAVGVSSKGDVYLFKAKSVILACGGANRIYSCVPEWIRSEKYRTTGDAYKLAFDAGAYIIDLEYPNFRETPPGASRVGGIYLNAEGERFMQRYDPVALEKAPRQLMVAAIFSELQAGRGPIHWHIDKKLLEKDAVFANVFKNKETVEIGIDFQRLLGGARINERAQTDVPHLFAAGESAGGLHGADRMQANGFLDTQIFGARAGYYAAKLAEETAEADIDMAQVDDEGGRIEKISGNIDPKKVIKTIQETMWEFGGVVRDADGLSKALNVFQGLKNDQIPKLSEDNLFYSLEAMNLLFAAEMITTAALVREESRGSHRRKDYPRKNDKLWKKHIAVYNKKGKMAITELPVKTLKDRIGK